MIRRIARCPSTFTELQSQEIVAAAEPFALSDRYGVMAPTWRVLDRRLQVLRKSGRIEFVKGTWVVAGTGRLL